MHRAPAGRSGRRHRTAASKPHTHTPITASTLHSPVAINEKHARRIRLIAAISGGKLSRMCLMIRMEFGGANGNGSCRRLRSGSVDCSCDYCEFFWSRLERKLTAPLD